MALKWLKEDTELLINSIEQYPCLYKVGSAEYLDRTKKEQALNDILELMRHSMTTITIENIKQKWRSVRSQYAHEQRLMHNSKKSGCEYVPKLWCFSLLSFLEINTKIRQDNSKENDETNVNNARTGTEDKSLIKKPRQKKKRVADVKEIRGSQKINIIKMDSLKFEENKCRICFQDDAKVNWNDYLQDNDQITYKECYYKYTQLNCYDGDNLYLSLMLCRGCSNNLENINAFITKAIESHDLLKERLALHIEKINFDIQNVSMYEGTCKESLNEESDAWSMNEDNMNFVTQIKRRKRKSKRGCQHDNTETSLDELQNDKMISKKNHSSRRWEKPAYCSICPKVLASKYSAIKHEKTHLENRERNEICSECGIKFFDKAALKLHMQTHNENREKKHKCEFCDKAFYLTGDLNIHRRIHLGQMVPCSLCTKKFCRQIDLDKHMISHSASRINFNLKPKSRYLVRCKHCSKDILSTSYKSHTAAHLNQPLMKCSICNKEFFRRDSCRHHLKTVHKIKAGEMNHRIILYKKNRLNHLYLRQTADIQQNKD